MQKRVAFPRCLGPLDNFRPPAPPSLRRRSASSSALQALARTRGTASLPRSKGGISSSSFCLPAATSDSAVTALLPPLRCASSEEEMKVPPPLGGGGDGRIFIIRRGICSSAPVRLARRRGPSRRPYRPEAKGSGKATLSVPRGSAFDGMKGTFCQFDEDRSTVRYLGGGLAAELYGRRATL